MKRTKKIQEAIDTLVAYGYEIIEEYETEIEAMNYDNGKSATVYPDGRINGVRLDRWQRMMCRPIC